MDTVIQATNQIHLNAPVHGKIATKSCNIYFFPVQYESASLIQLVTLLASSLQPRITVIVSLYAVSYSPSNSLGPQISHKRGEN